MNENGIVYPSNFLHISTLPLKVAGMMPPQEKPSAVSWSTLYKKLGAPQPIRKSEADSATTQGAVLRPEREKKESQKPLDKKYLKLRETSQDHYKKHVFQVVLIKEGMGNFKDRFFYTKEALQNAAASQLFEGLQCFADHPTEIEEQVQPERSTRDILGYYGNVQYLENAQGQGELIADLNVSTTISLDWALSLLTNSIEYSTKFKETDLVGLSINASGSAEPIELDAFLSANPNLAPPVFAKLNEARMNGVSQINVVNELKDAQSVDLVTKAGAGGKILKILEQEKQMAKNFFESESEVEKKEKKEAGMPPMGHGDAGKAPGAAAAGPADGATADHADAAQDQALFAKMIKQYLGKDDADEEECKMAQHAYQAHKEMGMEHEAAYEAAGQHLKMAGMIGKKMHQAMEPKEGEEKHEGEEKEGAEAHHEDGNTSKMPQSPNDKSGKGPSVEKKESDVIILSAEVAKLRESLKKFELRDYLDAKLAKCGKSNTITKKFKEALGTPKSKTHIDETWNLFVKVLEAASEEVGVDSESLFVEKTPYRAQQTSGKMSFEDCVE